MSVDVSIDPGDPTPPYEQLRRQLATHITTGALGPGTRLAPVRHLAAALDLANGTVARAYRELESTGLVMTRRGGGTTVLGQSADDTEPRRRERLTTLATAFVAQSRGLGLGDKDALAAVRDAQKGTDG